MAYFFQIDQKQIEEWAEKWILACAPFPQFKKRQSICQERRFFITCYFLKEF